MTKLCLDVEEIVVWKDQTFPSFGKIVERHDFVVAVVVVCDEVDDFQNQSYHFLRLRFVVVLPPPRLLLLLLHKRLSLLLHFQVLSNHSSN